MTDHCMRWTYKPYCILPRRMSVHQLGLMIIAFLIASASGLSDAPAANRVALVIGNSQYLHASKLVNPENDAKLMAETLRRQGFDVLEYTNLAFKEMLRAFAAFTSKLQESGRETDGFIFYAGHGLQVNGLNFVIPVDARIEKEADVEIEAVSATALMRSVSLIGNRLNIIVLDACRNNPYRSLFRSASRGLARMDAPIGSMVAFSTAPGMVAADGSGKNSPYTTALAKAISTPGLKVEDVFKRARNEVYQVTNGAQVPWESSSIFDDFYFSKTGPATAKTPDPKETAAVTKPAATGGDEAAKVWTTIENTQSRGILTAFIKRFPKSLYAEFATVRLAELKAGAAVERATEKSAAPGPTKIAVARPPNPAISKPLVKAPVKPDKRFRAVLAEGREPLTKGLRWDVFDAKTDGDGKRKHITHSYDAAPKFKLKDGRYYVTVAYGNARASGEVDVRSVEQWGRLFILNAGRLTVTASLAADSDVMKKGLRFDVYDAKLDEDDKRKHISHSYDWRAKFALPAGQYYVTAAYGNARAEGELTIAPGELIKQNFALNAGRLTLTASLADGGEDEKTGLRWDVYGAELDEDDKRKHITHSYDWRAKFTLPVGRYYITTQKGNAASSAAIEIGAAKLTKRKLVLNAGRLSLTAALSDNNDIQKNGVRWDVYGAETDEDGKRRHVIHSYDWRTNFYLPAGRYYITVSQGNARSSSEVAVAPGKRTSERIVLNAGKVKLAALLKKGGTPIPKGLRWDIYSAKKDLEGKRRHITHSYDAEPLFTLNSGTYAITVIRGKAKREFTLTVKPGDRKKVNIDLAP